MTKIQLELATIHNELVSIKAVQGAGVPARAST
jgi:hypothetical protein